MPHVLEPHLQRMAELLDAVGPDVLLRAPLLTPDDHWFPDRWSPDVESARRLLMRLCEYAGLPELEVECRVLYGDDPASDHDLGRSPGACTTRGVLGTFEGIVESCAWFRVNTDLLRQPKVLVGTLAHEVAHAWRQVRGVVGDDRAIEEEFTDLTTIVLGFGILTANAAYVYEQGGLLLGGTARTTSAHRQTGYLPDDVMSGLLAAFVLARRDDANAVRRALAPTQADAFRAACEWLEPLDLDDFLRLPPHRDRPRPSFTRAPRREFAPGRAARAVHAAVEAVTKAIGDASGLLERPIDFEYPAVSLPHVGLAHWGRADAAGGWYRALHLVADPEWATQLLLMDIEQAGAAWRVALGHVRDRDARDPARLAAVLAPLFGGSHARVALCHPALPAFVAVLDSRALPERTLRALCERSAARFDAATLAREAEWLRSYHKRAFSRVEAEVAAEPFTPSEPVVGDATRAWWSAATDPVQADDELSLL